MWQKHPVDGGVLSFHRESGTNVLVRNADTRASLRAAPRSLQIGLLTPCNLRCGFCYRDTSAPSRLSFDFLVDLLRKADQWGVLEVAFGGGEPLLFPRFLELLRTLHADTGLGLNFTSNGTLLTDAWIGGLEGLVGELRISAYADNGYRETIRRASRRLEVGVNWLVTPTNLGLVEAYVHDFLELGARNVLLLGYKGADRSMHLDAGQLAQLQESLVRMGGLPLRLDVCWHPHLTQVDHLFRLDDCRAGDEFLVITPDRAVQACSFQRGRQPFNTFEELVALYRQLRSERPAADVQGCTRPLFVSLRKKPLPSVDAAWVWPARAANNSGDWTIAARFCSEQEAQRAAESLRELSRAHEAFLASPEGAAWVEQHDYDGSHPTPPLQRFGAEHGFEWNAHGEGLWWEEDGAGGPVLTAGAVGDAVVVYHPYCMGLPEEPFRRFFRQVGATEFAQWQYERPRVVVHALGHSEAAERAMVEYLSLVNAAKYPSEVKGAPPWGAEADDSRVQDDEDRVARLARGPHELRREAERIELMLAFENTFAGALALESWLRAEGYREVQVRVESGLGALARAGDQPGRAGAGVEPKLGLFGDLRPMAERLTDASDDQVLTWLFEGAQLPELYWQHLSRISADRLNELALARLAQYRLRALDVTEAINLLAEHQGASVAPVVREHWNAARRSEQDAQGRALRGLRAALPADEAFALALAWMRAPSEHTMRGERLLAFHSLRHSGTLESMVEWWTSAAAPPPVTDHWARLAVASQLDWPTAEAWLRRGRPLSLIALDALVRLREAPSASFAFPGERALRSALERYLAVDSAPRPARAIAFILQPAKPAS
jgi:MoaA/NifB/PqqE/SkfB family radical SAM enzyme